MGPDANGLRKSGDITGQIAEETDVLGKKK